jgi:TM2 domain-containing membrane protein YozV
MADPNAPFGRDPFTGEPLSNKSKIAAGLLQLFLGGFGAGRFYLGSNGIAIAQLCTLIIGWLLTFVLVGFFVLFGLTIWVLIDAIMILTGSVRDSRGFKLKD